LLKGWKFVDFNWYAKSEEKKFSSVVDFELKPDPLLMFFVKDR
jgi:hypothetical protein